ncbi:MAG: GH25 family lysozyme [Liquorilactobacillus mali]|uniref:GH25 family lysozyme n=1 Tax=Liquorilactobacillus mali TaxID=1618 RepID=UPI0039EC5250
MYRVTIENNGIETIIHDDYFTKYRLTETTIAQGINAADSFQFNILPSNPGYSLLQEWITYIEVMNMTSSKLIFKGRVASVQIQLNSDGTFYKQVICESQMAFLNDSIQTYKKVQMKPYDFFKYLIDTHNAQVDSKRQFQLGNVTVTNSTNYLYCYIEDGLKTFDEIDTDLISNDGLGGELKIRNENGVAYIDWTLDQNVKGKQEIKLNKNLISLYTKPNLSGILTVLYPFGATIESDSTDSSTDTASDVASPRLDISSVNGGKKYIESAELINRYGRISGTKSWDDVTVASNLLTKAKAYLETFKPVTIGYELEAVDLFQLGLAVDDFEVGNYYHVINQIEGIDDYFRIISISLDINNPLQSSLTIGDKSVSWAEFQNQIQRSNAIVSGLQIKAAQLEASTLAAQKKLTALQETVDSIPDNLQSVKNELQKQIDELKDSTWVSGSIFIDVSQYQSDTSVTWFTKCVNAGAKGVMVKLSDGSSGDENNALASKQLANSATAGLKLVGCYHYFENIANATAEANNFVAQLQANNIDKSKIVALDIEGNVLSNSKTDLDSAITTFLEVLTGAGYTNTCLYGSESSFTNNAFDGSLAKYKWIGSWDSSTKPDGADGWQFSNDWQGYGVDASYSYSKAFV